MAETYSVSQLARMISKSDNTVRNWTGILADYLSQNLAERGRGIERRYNDDDVRIFQTVKIMRDQQKPFDEITPFIQEGELLEPSEDGAKTTTAVQIAPENKAALQVQVQMQGDMLKTANDRIEALEAELREEREARIDAQQEETKSKAERRAELLEAELRFWGQPWHKRLFGRSSTALILVEEPKEDSD